MLQHDVVNAPQDKVADVGLHIVVRTVAGESRVFFCQPQATIDLLKEKIYESMGHPQFIQKLILVDKPLVDGNLTLTDHNMTDGTILTLVLDAQARAAADAAVLFNERTLLHNWLFQMREFVEILEDVKLAAERDRLLQEITKTSQWLYNCEVTVEEIHRTRDELNERLSPLIAK